MEKIGEIEILELFRRIDTHPGQTILKSLREFASSQSIMEGNAQELLVVISQLEDASDPLGVMGLDNRDKLEAWFLQVHRLLHNFLVSASTLVDHTRNLIKGEYITEEHRADHEAHKNAIFVGDPLSGFVKDFRNYIVHRGLPRFGLTMCLGADASICLSLDAPKLLSWDKWTARSRVFLENNFPNLEMLAFVVDYQNKVKDFGVDFVKKFSYYYDRELGELFALGAEWKRRNPPED